MNTWAEAIKAIGALEDRVKKLETSKNQLFFVDHGVLHHTNDKSETIDGRIVVSANEYARLERIERAAMRVRDFSEPFTNVDGPLPTANDLCWIHCEIVAANVGSD